MNPKHLSHNKLDTLLDKNRQRKVVFYGRVSTEHEQQLSALQNQMQWYDDQLKYHPNWELAGKYIDEGITGTQAKKRPQFLKMIEQAKTGEFDLIVTREVCRFARNTVDTLLYTRQLKSDFGIEVYFVEDNIWTMDGDGELRLTIMATLAQEESRKTSERVRAGQYISRQNGVVYGSGNILGYDRKDSTYVINEEQAETVRLIFDLYLSGLGAIKICRELEKRGRKNASGKVKWTPSQITRIIKRSTYKGVLAYNQSQVNNYLDQRRINNKDRGTYEYVQGDFPPIIPPHIWDEAQRVLKERTSQCALSNIQRGRKTTNDIWLKKLKCSCGNKFRRNVWRTNKSGETHYGYQCYQQVNVGSKTYREKNGLDSDGYCSVKMIADWKLELMAKEVIASVWQDRSQSVIEAYQMIVDNYTEDSVEQLKQNSAKETLKKLNARLDNLTEMRLDGEIGKTQYLELKTKIENQISETQADLDTFQQEHQGKRSMQNKLEEIKQALESAIDFTQNKLPTYIIDRFVYQIVPYDNGVFKWYIKLTDGDDITIEDTQEITVGVIGKKNNPEITGLNFKKNSLPSNQCNSGCNRRRVGEQLTYIIPLTFDIAKKYRKCCGGFLRQNQWNDMCIEAHIII